MKRVWLFVKAGITLVLVILLVRHVDWSTVGSILKQTEWWLIGIYCLMQLFGTYLSALKWSFLSRVQGFTLAPRLAFFLYLMGAFINNFFPSTIGGDAYRTLKMSKLGERYRAFTVVLVDRMSGLVGLVVLGCGALWWLPWSALRETAWLSILLSGMVGATLFALVACVSIESFYASLLALARRFLGQKASTFLSSFETFARVKPYRGAIAYSLLFALIGVGITNYFLFLSLGMTLPMTSYVGAIFIATLVANIPVTINNIGVKEWSYVFFFGLIGVSAEVAVTVVLLSRALQFILSLLALPAYVREKKLLRVSKDVTNQTPELSLGDEAENFHIVG